MLTLFWMLEVYLSQYSVGKSLSAFSHYDDAYLNRLNFDIGKTFTSTLDCFVLACFSNFFARSLTLLLFCSPFSASIVLAKVLRRHFTFSPLPSVRQYRMNKFTHIYRFFQSSRWACFLLSLVGVLSFPLPRSKKGATQIGICTQLFSAIKERSLTPFCDLGSSKAVFSHFFPLFW